MALASSLNGMTEVGVVPRIDFTLTLDERRVRIPNNRILAHASTQRKSYLFFLTFQESLSEEGH